MRIYDIIARKRDSKELSKEEINFFVQGYVNDEIKDYQISALLMAIYLNGMTGREIAYLTESMSKSGDMADLTAIPGIKVDKHSTGGVGDKTTLICAPIAAACGVPIAKMSGRGLGYTGGTIDKMDAIPNMRTALNEKEFVDIVKDIGISVVSQSGNLVPADKKIYALRDVTATIESIPLIASSIMSKKIASGADRILLDVKTGTGAFMKTEPAALELAKTMVEIGKNTGRKTVAIITDMNTPLGYAIGNSLEIAEICEVLKGRGPSDLREVSLCLAANMLYLAGKGTIEECLEKSSEVIDNGRAFEKLKIMVDRQGGDSSVLDNPDKLIKSDVIYKVESDQEGYLYKLDAESCGKACVIAGAGRENKESDIDLGAGIVLKKKLGDYVKSGETLAEIHSSTIDKCVDAKNIFLRGIHISKDKPENIPIIKARITEDGIQKF